MENSITVSTHKIERKPPPELKILVANEQLEVPFATVELQFEVSDITFRKNFIAMTNPTSLLIGLLFLQRNSSTIDMGQGILMFLFSSMQPKKCNKKIIR